MTIQQIKDQLYRGAMDCMNAGGYVTIVCYVRLQNGTDRIVGQTFKNLALQC